MEERSRTPVGPPVANPLPSYWHNPKSPLANVIEPETDNPTQTYDYAIIGSGISGTMIAHNLLKADPSSRIVMIEAREICSGATGRNGGHTKAASYRTYLQHVQEFGKDEALKIARLEYANIIETHRMAKELGIDCESVPCNTVDIIYDVETFSQAKEAIEALRSDATEAEKQEGGMAWYKIHDNTPETREKFHVAATNTNPSIPSHENVVGVIEYFAGRIHAYRFSTAILNRCTRRGLVLSTNTPVTSISPSPTCTETHPSWDIHSHNKRLTAHSVVLATNGYTPYLLPEFQGKVVPMRGQITAQRPINACPAPLQTTYSFIYKEGYEYMIPRPLSALDIERNAESTCSGTIQDILIGGGLGRLPYCGAAEFGIVDDASLNPDVSQYLKGSLANYFTGAGWEVRKEWTGIMGATHDGVPFVGEVQGKKGVWVCAGFNGHGMVLCVKSAEALVGCMREGEWAEWWPTSFCVSAARLDGVFSGRRV